MVCDSDGSDRCVCVCFGCQEHVIVKIVNVNHMRELMSNYCDFQRHLLTCSSGGERCCCFSWPKSKGKCVCNSLLWSAYHTVSLSIAHVGLMVCVVPRYCLKWNQRNKSTKRKVYYQSSRGIWREKEQTNVGQSETEQRKPPTNKRSRMR